MRIHSESIINHSRDAVFEAYRDRLTEIAPYIPDIGQIVVESRSDHPDKVELHNVWIAEREVPAYARAFIRPDMLRWDDFATWHETTKKCSWRLRIRAFPDSVRCSGTNTFSELGPNRTRVLLEGDLQIDVKKIPGVPRLVAGRVGPKVEQFIVSLITPNLERVNSSLGRFLDDQG
ncbi:MAG TPA: hypothetical protein QGF58_04570 [Myxococcota bacterium]|nr:hypothetical protein [Myxococcota bacterium]